MNPSRRRKFRPIRRFVLAVVSWPRATLAVTLALVAASIALSWGRLELSTDQNKLFSADVPFFRDFVAFDANFPESEATYVLVRAKPGTDERAIPVGRWTAAADAIAARLSAMTGVVRAVDARVAPETLGRQAILFEDPAQLRATVDDAREFARLAQLFGERPNLATGLLGANPLERLLASLALAPKDARTARFVALVADSLARTVETNESAVGSGQSAVKSATSGPVRAASATRDSALNTQHSVSLPDLAALDAGDPSRLGYYYLIDELERDRHLLLIHVHLKVDQTTLTGLSDAVDAIRAAAADAGKAFPEFAVGLTGRPVLAADEMRTTDQDSTKAEVVALSAVFVGVVLLLRSWWLALASEVALGVGIAWTLAWAALARGELNLLSIVFFLALIGIGMDYLIQILSRYRAEARLRSSPRTTWLAVFRQVGPPINTACAGAAGAFLVSLLTDFSGAADLGLIAGGGLLLCLLAGYTFLPALLTVWPGKRARTDGRGWRPEGAAARPSPSSIVQPRASAHRFAPLIWLTLLVAATPFAFRTTFNPSLIDLQAQGLESVQLVRRLQTWSAVVLSKDLDAIRAAREAVRASPTVGRTESVLDAWDNHAALHGGLPALPKIEWAEPAPVTADRIPRLGEMARSLSAAYGRGTGYQPVSESQPHNTHGLAAHATNVAAALERLAHALEAARGESTAAAAAAVRLSAWQLGFIDQLKEFVAAFDPPPPDFAKAPPALRDHLIGRDGAYALYIYPREDLWNQAKLDAFVRDVESRVKQLKLPVTLTGIAHNIHHSTAAIRRSFYTATAYALGLIVLLVLLDLRSVRHTLLAVSVLALGLPMLVGLMGLFGVDWNFANFFGLPILIGAGHEYGVFLVHRYREAKRDPATRAWPAWDVADKALLLCAFVTSSSFGFFWVFARHQGLASLGLVMALGSACIYLASVIALRPVLKMRLARARKLV